MYVIIYIPFFINTLSIYIARRTCNNLNALIFKAYSLLYRLGMYQMFHLYIEHMYNTWIYLTNHSVTFICVGLIIILAESITYLVHGLLSPYRVIIVTSIVGPMFEVQPSIWVIWMWKFIEKAPYKCKMDIAQCTLMNIFFIRNLDCWLE